MHELWTGATTASISHYWVGFPSNIILRNCPPQKFDISYPNLYMKIIYKFRIRDVKIFVEDRTNIILTHKVYFSNKCVDAKNIKRFINSLKLKFKLYHVFFKNLYLHVCILLVNVNTHAQTGFHIQN